MANDGPSAGGPLVRLRNETKLLNYSFFEQNCFLVEKKYMPMTLNRLQFTPRWEVKSLK
jgi:hypothetical protein